MTTRSAMASVSSVSEAAQTEDVCSPATLLCLSCAQLKIGTVSFGGCRSKTCFTDHRQQRESIVPKLNALLPEEISKQPIKKVQMILR